MTELETGAIVLEHYVIVSLLGVGGMGMVYRARDVRTDELHAIKVLREARGDLATRFLREARIASALSHPNIATVREVLELADGTPAIVMDLLDGESLGARLARLGKLQAAPLARIGLGVVAAMKAAHARGVVHRDLKPDNVFLCADGAVKVLDFGIAKIVDATDPAITASALTETGQILGTPHYMAPEQIFGEKDVDARADVWALGVILYQALAGARPFEGDNPGQIFKAIAFDPPVPLAQRAPHTPPELAELVSRMLVHARKERLADLDLIARVLERVVVDVGEAATLHEGSAADGIDRQRARVGRRRSLVATVAVAAAAVSTATVIALWPSPPPKVTSSAPGAASAAPPAPDAALDEPASPPSAAEPTPSAPEAPRVRRAPPSPASPASPASSAASPASGQGLAVPAAPALATSATGDAGGRPHRSGALKRDEF